MYKVIDSTKIYSENNEKIMYCVKTNRDDKLRPRNSQLIVVYDLDQDGILRAGFPNNPFTRNMFFGRINEVVFYKNNGEYQETNNGIKRVYSTYYNAYNSVLDIEEDYDDIYEISIDKDTQIVNHINSLGENKMMKF